MSLNFYQKEWSEYPKHYDVKYSQIEATKVINKLVRHFKLKNRVLDINYDTSGFGVSQFSGIRLPKDKISLGMICHELGHHYAKMKTGKWNHCYKTYSKMKQIYRYAQKFLPQEVIK